MKKQISFGNRPKNPLRRRVWKDMLRDWKRYLMICLMLIVTIGFVSGMYVANNSMLNTLSENVDTMKREHGHFTLSKKADKATIKAIETGEMADVPAVYRERAYDEAADEVEKAVNAAFEENVAAQVCLRRPVDGLRSGAKFLRQFRINSAPIRLRIMILIILR